MSKYPEANMLANALSPYLQQHARNPVHWREWGPAAFAEAKEKNLPILLSIGYAACHWCHVMAHESFEDLETAQLMNRCFVNIKLDREERPDVDQIYMNALQGMGQQGGWPLTMFLTPEGEPFWGGTYFPPSGSYGRPGFVDVLEAIDRLRLEDPDRIARNSDAIKAHLQQRLAAKANASRPAISDLHTVSRSLLEAIDPVNGGLGAAPKFPAATMWEALWRDWVRRRDTRMRDAALAWIRALCLGGIYDHLGGGIHRYTVDERWLVPHFEKMLYDNAQLLRSLCAAYAETLDPMYRERIEGTAEFLLRDMQSPGGGFCSSLDADSEGKEGSFYVWSHEEIDDALGAGSSLFKQAYDVSAGGNWEGRNILNRLAGKSFLPEEERSLADSRRALLAIRDMRVWPPRDDKVLTDWNGLAIRALAEAGLLLGNKTWTAAAQRAYRFVVELIVKEERLFHAWRAGTVAGPAFATDYAAMINAAVTLHLATGDPAYLAQGEEFAEQLKAWHTDGIGGFFLAPADRTNLLIRARSDQDEAIPSATAMSVEALARLAQASGNPAWFQSAENAMDSAWGRIQSNPFASIGIVNAADTVLRSPKLVTTGSQCNELLEIARRHPDPARLDLHLDLQASVSRHVASSDSRSGAAVAYLCRGTICLPPVSTPEELDLLLSEASA